METHGAVGVIRLNRPAIRNALSLAMIGDLASAVDLMERDPEIGAIVVTGNAQAFAAGGDVKEFVTFKSFVDVFMQDFNAGNWLRWPALRAPRLHAVFSLRDKEEGLGPLWRNGLPNSPTARRQTPSRTIRHDLSQEPN